MYEAPAQTVLAETHNSLSALPNAAKARIDYAAYIPHRHSLNWPATGMKGFVMHDSIESVSALETVIGKTPDLVKLKTIDHLDKGRASR